ncbi:MAG: hypothetical protein WD270_03460, partial [Acetobacterales bacterium]
MGNRAGQARFIQKKELSMTVLKRMIPALAVTGALVLPMQAMAAKVVSEIQDIDKTAGTIMLDGGQL